jgi:hypothetical protein
MRSLRCLFGLHQYVRRETEDGDPYVQCTRCGRYRDTSHASGTLPWHPNT